MKKFYFVILIITTVIAISIVMNQTISEKPNTEYTEKIISITYIPSYYKGVVKNIPENINHIDKYLNIHPVILESLENALEIPIPMKRDDPVRQGITLEHNNVKYYIIQTGPQVIRIESLLTAENYEKVRQWSSVNLDVDHAQYNIDHYNIKYKNELFFMKIGDDSILMKNAN